MKIAFQIIDLAKTLQVVPVSLQVDEFITGSFQDHQAMRNDTTVFSVFPVAMLHQGHFQTRSKKDCIPHVYIKESYIYDSLPMS